MSQPAKKISQPSPNPIPWWAPRFWVGTDFVGWTSLMARNRFRISPTRLQFAVAGSFYGLINAALRGVQDLVYGRRIADLQITHAPIFILGHWRCGTTLLHELLILDQQHAFPNTWQCFSPNHFLLTERLGKRYLKFVLPKQRPMDNMPLNWEYPQEDEFALCNLGLPTPYASIIFPNEPPQYREYLDLEGLAPAELERWKRIFTKFLKQVTYANPKRIVLKSPPHTARIKVLLELFPDARFVHIARDPFVVFPSTIHLWKSLYQSQALQSPRYEHLEEHVFDTFSRMHETYLATRELIPAGRLYETRYEDLLADPVGQMQAVYQQLELGDFERARPAIEQYFAEKKTYKTNRYGISPELQQQISTRWADYIQRYGYSTEPASV